MNRILKILPFLLLCAFALQVMPVGAQQQMLLSRTQQAAPPPSAGLLDPDYKGSAFAAAIDVLLYGSYTATDDIPGSQTFGQQGQWSVAVLRDFDDAIKSFTPSQVADGTANAWVQALGPSDGFVRRWYDQSVTALDVSNLNHADQESKPSMEKLFDSASGVILDSAGDISIENFQSSLVVGAIPQYDQISNTDYSLFLCSEIATSPTQSILVGDFSTPDNYMLVADQSSTNTLLSARYSGVNLYIEGVLESPSNRGDVYTLLHTGGSLLISVIYSTLTGFDQADDYIRIGGLGNGTSFTARKKTKLVVLFQSDESSNRTGIEAAIQTKY